VNLIITKHTMVYCTE